MITNRELDALIEFKEIKITPPHFLKDLRLYWDKGKGWYFAFQFQNEHSERNKTFYVMNYQVIYGNFIFSSCYDKIPLNEFYQGTEYAFMYKILSCSEKEFNSFPEHANDFIEITNSIENAINKLKK